MRRKTCAPGLDVFFSPRMWRACHRKKSEFCVGFRSGILKESPVDCGCSRLQPRTFFFLTATGLLRSSAPDVRFFGKFVF